MVENGMPMFDGIEKRSGIYKFGWRGWGSPLRWLLIISSCLCLTAAFWFVLSVLINQDVNPIGDILQIQSQLNLNFMTKLLVFLGGLAIFAIVLFAGYFSHSLSGPLYRIECAFQEIKDGNLNQYVRIRQGDEFKDTIGALNMALANLRKKSAVQEESIADMIERLSGLMDHFRLNGQEEEARSIENLISDVKNTSPLLKI